MIADLKILVVEDNQDDANLLDKELKRSGLRFISQIVQTRQAFEDALQNFIPDIILADYSLPAFDAVTAFRIKQNKSPHIPFIIVSGVIGEENAVDLMKEGVTDFAPKNKLFVLPQKIRRALKDAEERKDKEIITKKLELQATALIIANKNLKFQNEENEKRSYELSIAYKNLQQAREDLQLQEVIKLSEKSFRQLADLIPHIVWTTTADGGTNYYNKQWFEYTGFEEGHSFKDWIALLHIDDVKPWQETFTNSIKTGNPYQIEFRFKDQANPGNYRWFLCRALPVKESGANITKWIGTCTDIDDAKRKQEELQQTDKRRGDFIKMVSHELKTPVTSIKGYVQLLLIKLEEEKGKYNPVQIKNSLSRISYQVSRLTRLISEMLDVSRIETGKLELYNTLFSLNDLVTETVDDILHTTTRHTISVHHEVNCTINGDRGRIEQVVINFVANAIKYSPDNSQIEIRILDAGNEKNQVAVSVKDDGIGIDSTEYKKIFERFYRVSEKNEQTYPGFGIGLFIAKEIIGRHNGSISIESEIGKGSTFTFTLPLVPEKQVAI